MYEKWSYVSWWMGNKGIHCKISCGHYSTMVDKFGTSPIVSKLTVHLCPADVLSVPFCKLLMAIISGKINNRIYRNNGENDLRKIDSSIYT